MSRPAKLHKNWLRWRPCPGWTGRTGFLGEEPHPGPTHHVVLLGGRVVFPEPAEGVLYVPLDHLPAVGGGTPASRGRENSLSHMWGCPTLSPQPRPAASWHWQPWVCLWEAAYFCHQEPCQYPAWGQGPTTSPLITYLSHVDTTLTPEKAKPGFNEPPGSLGILKEQALSFLPELDSR